MVSVVLLGKFLTGKNDLVSIDNDNVVTAVNVRSIGCFDLASEDSSNFICYSAEGFACSVDNVPFTLDVACICHKCAHLHKPP